MLTPIVNVNDSTINLVTTDGRGAPTNEAGGRLQSSYIALLHVRTKSGVS